MSDKPKRKMCAYGDKCYRKNPAHLRQYYHAKENEDVLSNKNQTKPKLSSSSSNENLTRSNVSIADRKDFIKRKFLFNMPDDFYFLWELASEMRRNHPEDFLSEFNLKLVGPFAALQPSISDIENLPDEEYLVAWRYFFDVPEFQTVIAATDSAFHIGYYRDDPDEVSLVCSNNPEVGCKLNIIGDNIIGALHHHLTSVSKITSTADILQKLDKIAQLHKLSTKPTASEKVKNRKKKVVSSTFHTAGIVVPVQNDVGYRPIPETDANLKKWLKIIDETDEEAVREEKLDKIHELISYVQFANDECDYGMGLELGIDLFCSGCAFVHKQIDRLLAVAYELLNRQKFATILNAHLKQRKPGEPLKLR